MIQGFYLLWQYVPEQIVDSALEASPFPERESTVPCGNAVAGQQPLEGVRANDRFRLAPNVTMGAGGNTLDDANTFDVRRYEVYGITAPYEGMPSRNVFRKARKATGEEHSLNDTSLADATDPSVRLDVFTPGADRSVFGGTRPGLGR
ncbi:hypothetical protein [Parvularcula dongshanensis]|uniref:hypothetical protein n=1 Tax=Parvularcula dongshanensis TaxID=1173995 RepID=UPI00160E5C16|nr:hypothetical protein [Parvularcula dongshanensis]